MMRSPYAVRRAVSCVSRGFDHSSPKLPHVLDSVPWRNSSHGASVVSVLMSIAVSSKAPVTGLHRYSFPGSCRLFDGSGGKSTRRPMAFADCPARSTPKTLSPLMAQATGPRVSSPRAAIGSVSGTCTSSAPLASRPTTVWPKLLRKSSPRIHSRSPWSNSTSIRSSGCTVSVSNAESARAAAGVKAFLGVRTTLEVLSTDTGVRARPASSDAPLDASDGPLNRYGGALGGAGPTASASVFGGPNVPVSCGRWSSGDAEPAGNEGRGGSGASAMLASSGMRWRLLHSKHASCCAGARNLTPRWELRSRGMDPDFA